MAKCFRVQTAVRKCKQYVYHGSSFFAYTYLVIYHGSWLLYLVGTYHTGAKINTPSRINFRADFHQKSWAWGGEGRTQQNCGLWKISPITYLSIDAPLLCLHSPLSPLSRKNQSIKIGKMVRGCFCWVVLVPGVIHICCVCVCFFFYYHILILQSRFGDELLENRLVCPVNGTVV